MIASRTVKSSKLLVVQHKSKYIVCVCVWSCIRVHIYVLFAFTKSNIQICKTLTKWKAVSDQQLFFQYFCINCSVWAIAINLMWVALTLDFTHRQPQRR